MHLRTRTTLRTLFALLAATLLSARPAVAQQGPQITVRAEAPDKIYLGVPADLRIAITGSRDAEAPDLSGLKDFDAAYIAPQDASSTMTMIINGRVSTKVDANFSHLYSLTARRAGQLELPAIPVIVEGRTYTTAPRTITVVEPRQAADFKLTVACDAAEAFVGQPIIVRITWTLGMSAREPIISLPIGGPEHTMLPGPITRALTGREAEAVMLRVNGQQALALNRNNEIIVDRVIIPAQPGTLVIGPVRVDFLAVLGQRQGGGFDAFFQDRAITERQFSAAPPVAIPIAALPLAGKPADFSGLVGTYSINASADASNVSVGDPINLSIGVTGPFPLSLVPALDIARQSKLAAQFRVPRDPVIGQQSASAVAFGAMIRARTPDVKEIGPITLSYFDPSSKSYKIAATRPIPLTLRPSLSVTLPDLPDDEPSVSPPAPTHRPGGLSDIIRTPSSIPGESIDLSSRLLSPTVLAMLAAPPLLCLLTFASARYAAHRRRDPAGLRRRAAFSRLRRALRAARHSPNPAPAFSHAITDFAADCFDQPPASLTGRAAADLLSASQTTAGGQLASTLSDLDRARFGPIPSPVQRDALIASTLAAARIFSSALRARPHRTASASERRAILLLLTAGAIAFLTTSAPAQLLTPTPATTRESAGVAFDGAVHLLQDDPPAARAALRQAAAAYEQLAAGAALQHDRAALLYNAGAASHLAGDLGPAVLNLRRAETLAPLTPGLSERLAAARAEAAGALASVTSTFPLRGDPDPLHLAVGFLRSIPTSIRLTTLLASAASFWLLLTLRIALPRHARSPSSLILASALVALLAAASLADALLLNARHRHDLVLLNDATPRSVSDDRLGIPAAPLKAGREVIALESRLGGDGQTWLRIADPAAPPIDAGAPQPPTAHWIPAAAAGHVLPAREPDAAH